MEKFEREERSLFTGSKKGEERAYIFNEEFKRKERITLLIVFLLTIPILIYAFIHNNSLDGFGNRIGDYKVSGEYYPWVSIAERVMPISFLTGNSYPQYPIFPLVVSLAVGVTFAVFLPMALRKKTRRIGAVCMMAASYILLFFLWICSFGVVMGVHGAGQAIFGLAFGYVGIIPLALLGSFGNLTLFIPLLVLTACFAAAWKIKKRAREKYAESLYYEEENAAEPELPGAADRLKRAERLTISIIFCALAIIFVLTLINNNDTYILTKPGNIAVDEMRFPHSYWIWNAVIENIVPTGSLEPIGLFSYPTTYEPGTPFLFWLPLAAFLILLPMALFRRTRYKGAAGMMICSYVFAAVLWIYSLGVVMYAWGPAGAAVGACLGFVGIIPEALVAALGQSFIAGWWSFLPPLLFYSAFFIFARLIMNSARKKCAKEESIPEGSEGVKNEEVC